MGWGLLASFVFRLATPTRPCSRVARTVRSWTSPVYGAERCWSLHSAAGSGQPRPDAPRGGSETWKRGLENDRATWCLALISVHSALNLCLGTERSRPKASESVAPLDWPAVSLP